MAGKGGGNRQQKQAAKALRRRQAVAAKQQAERLASSPAGRIAAAAASPVERCLRLGDMPEAGIGHVILSKRLASGALGCGFFLVDLWCLGVKDAFYREVAPSELDERVSELEAGGQSMVPIDPPSAKKLILGAVAFAAGCGMAPAKDHRTVFKLFDGIDAEAATESFAFGRDGKAVYVPGPSDTPARMREIQRKLGHGPSAAEGNANAEANLALVKRFAADLKRRAGFSETDEVDPGALLGLDVSTTVDGAEAAPSLPRPEA